MGESMSESTQISTTAQLQSCGIELQITGYAWDKLMAYCRATNLEVSGFMLMVRDGAIITIKDAYIVEQECTGTSTEMSSTAIARLQMELFKKKIIGYDDDIKLAHFHTHCTFGVFWSQTDMILRQTMVAGTDYSLALVINHKGDALAALDINGEFPMSINNLPIEIVREENELIKACKAEVEVKVKAPAYQTGYQGYLSKDGTYENWRERQDRLDKEYALKNREIGLPKQATESENDYRRRQKRERRELRRRLAPGQRGRPSNQLQSEIEAMEQRLLGTAQAPEDHSDIRLALTEEELALGRRISTDDGIWSDESGTWGNIGGEIILLADKDGNTPGGVA